MQDKSLMFYMIRSELEDAVGTENVSAKEMERAVYSVDYFWLSRKWQDAGEAGPMPDIVVRPGSAEEVSKVLKIANYYKIPVTTWGGGSVSQGGALPVAGGILLDIKRMDKIIDINLEAGYVPAKGYTKICEIGKCSLKKLEFGIIELDAGQKLDFYTEDREVAFIMLEGHCDVACNGEVWEKIGNRSSFFENRRAESFYMPREQALEITARDQIKIAVCGTPVAEKNRTQVLREDHVVLKLLGEQPYQRETSFIIDGNSNAKVLTIGESYCTKGNWAGFPPHKHDTDNMPSECIAEEIYYFLFELRQGFAVQCMYTSDGSLDEAYRVKNDELVELPYGYHTTVSTPGYQTYFLWLMAGDYQGFNRSNDPEHEWIGK